MFRDNISDCHNLEKVLLSIYWAQVRDVTEYLVRIRTDFSPPQPRMFQNVNNAEVEKLLYSSFMNTYIHIVK